MLMKIIRYPGRLDLQVSKFIQDWSLANPTVPR